MKVDNIALKNYKGFEDCIVQFHPRMNVFIGSNGSGKTSLMTALLKVLSKIVLTQTHQYSSEKMILKNEDINYKENYASITATISDFINYPSSFKTFINTGAAQDLKSPSEIENQFKQVIKFLQDETISSVTIPIFKFYSANRGTVAYKEVFHGSVYRISQLETWSNIYQDDISYSKFLHWYFDNETDELRFQRDNNNFQIESPRLRDVRTALRIAFLELGYGSYNILSKQIKIKGSSKLLPSVFLKNLDTGIEESLDNKSDGEKAIITLIADIAYNLSIAKDYLIDDDFLKSPGIVMIDEIETHLHPKWQREILPILSRIFPNIQFFVATHSPQIVASVSSDSILVCDNFQVDNIHLKTKGEDSNSLLKYIFESTDRPKQYIQLINEFESLMEKNADYSVLKNIIYKVEEKYNQDEGSSISNLIDELNIRLAAYQFDKEYEKDR